MNRETRIEIRPRVHIARLLAFFLLLLPMSAANNLSDLRAAQGGGGSGSFLSANTARVDPSGNDDSNGTIGDLSKPFLTVQAAIDALASVSGNALLYLGLNSFTENIVVPSALRSTLIILGDNAEGGAQINGSVTLETPSGTENIFLTLLHCSVRAINANTTGRLTIVGQGAFIVNVVTNIAGPVTIESETEPSQIAGVSAGGEISLIGINYNSSDAPISAPGFNIVLSNCNTNYADTSGNYVGLIVIDSAGSEVWATNSLVGDVLAAGTLHLKDSRVLNTNNATSTVYADVLLKMADFNGSTLPVSDPAVTGRLWNDSGTLKISDG